MPSDLAMETKVSRRALVLVWAGNGGCGSEEEPRRALVLIWAGNGGYGSEEEPRLALVLVWAGNGGVTSSLAIRALANEGLASTPPTSPVHELDVNIRHCSPSQCHSRSAGQWCRWGCDEGLEDASAHSFLSASEDAEVGWDGTFC